jgi:hypothetical protein
LRRIKALFLQCFFLGMVGASGENDAEA